MLFKSLDFIREQLNIFLEASVEDSTISKPIVKLENIGGLDDTGWASIDHVLVTLVNVSEETTMKNTPHYVKENFTTVYRNPPVYLNLYVLFASCLKKYDHSLSMLSGVIRFFQGKNTFTHKNSITQVKDFENFKIIMDLYSPSFEQVNFLWSTLGGKQHPFVMYKMRLLELERESTEEIRGVIKEISMQEEMIPPKP